MALQWDRVTRPGEPPKYREFSGRFWIERFEGQGGMVSFWLIKFGGRIIGYEGTVPRAKQTAEDYLTRVRPPAPLSATL